MVLCIEEAGEISGIPRMPDSETRRILLEVLENERAQMGPRLAARRRFVRGAENPAIPLADQRPFCDGGLAGENLGLHLSDRGECACSDWAA